MEAVESVDMAIEAAAGTLALAKERKEVGHVYYQRNCGGAPYSPKNLDVITRAERRRYVP